MSENPDSKPLVHTSVYQKHQKIYPRQVHGRFANLRIGAVLVLLGLYYLVPWLRWDGHQAVLFDLPARKFYILGLTFWPQDFFYLAVLLVIAALSLFFFTALAGRLWCGYACPQTVWTEVFLWIERWLEGRRALQIKRDRQVWSTATWRVKITKHSVWLLFSLFTGYTFVGYFTPISELTQHIQHLELGPWEAFWVFFYGFATYGNAGWMREQVCIYMCPYARFQSAMFDRDTLVISYDQARGEPRGSRKQGIDYQAKNLGACVDCTLCVQVCPTGIDIREGLQYQCIGCAACVDVCDQVMDKMHYPKGLVRYTTENALCGKRTHILRPRMLLYAVLLIGLSVGLGLSIGLRTPLEFDVLRDRNALYRETPQGWIENVYTLKLINKDKMPHRYLIRVQGIEGLRLHERGQNHWVPAGELRSVVVSVQADPQALQGQSQAIRFSAVAQDDARIALTEPARFIGPVRH